MNTQQPAAGHWDWLRPPVIWRRVKAKGRRYWITAAIVFLLAATGSHYVYEKLHLDELRASVFQRLIDLAPRPTEPRFTRLVLIEDDEYWKGELAGRRPIKRKYLGRIVKALVKADAHVIALDFDVRLPTPKSPVIPPDYLDETEVLIQAIKQAAVSGKKIVLATPVSYHDNRYERDQDIYQAMGLCLRKQTSEPANSPETDADRIRKNVTCGYIALPYDALAIPGRLPVAGEPDLDSFALAIARASDPGLVRQLESSGRVGATDRYGSFMSDKKLREPATTITSADLLNGSPSVEILTAKAVIVGGDWSRDAAGRGPRVDQHTTPVGTITGAMLHANFVEAILDDRTFAATPEWILNIIELIFGLIAGVVFAILLGSRAKIAGIVGLVLVTFLAQWIMLHELGVFFDALVPVVGLGLHSLYERLLGGPEEAT